MEYNTQRGHLIIPEYGRNIQKMVEHAVKLKDREERNRYAQAIIAIMGYLNPALRDIVDFKHKLWDHLFIISNFKLDVDSPYPIPSKNTLVAKPKKVAYPAGNIKFRHFGRIMEEMVKEVAKVDDEAKREALTYNVANFMKMSYLNWNRDSVTDETIFENLVKLSNNKLKAKEDMRLNHTNELLAINAKKNAVNNQNSNNNKNKNKNKHKKKR
jgi:hypothetical protein